MSQRGPGGQFGCGEIAIAVILFFAFPPVGIFYILFKAGVFGNKKRGRYYQPGQQRYNPNPQPRPASTVSSSRGSSYGKMKLGKTEFTWDSIKDEKVKEVLKNGMAKLKEIRKYQKEIEIEHVKDKVKKIGDVVEVILEDFIHDASDVKKARQFNNYYLDSAVKIIKKYRDLSSKQFHSPDISESMKKAEIMMDTIEEAFKNQLGKLQENEAMELDVEMEVLEKTLKMEGF